MKKSNKEKYDVPAQGTLPKLKSQPVGPETMPSGFTSGDVFFNPETGPAPFSNPPAEDPTSQGPHPILHGKIAKSAPAPLGPKPAPKLVPPPPPVMPGQTTLPFQPTKPPAVPPKLVPPPPPVTFAPVPPPIPSPTPGETLPDATESTYQYPETEDEQEDEQETENEGELTPPEEKPGEDMSPEVPAPEPEKPEISPKENQHAPPAKPPSSLVNSLKHVKGIVELPVTLGETDFCGSLCMPVDDGHCVVLLLLAKQASTGPGEVTITADGLHFKTKGSSSPSALQGEVSAITSAAAKLQGDIAKDGPLIEQVITFLSGANLKILAPRAKVEAVTGPGGQVVGYFQGESLVQFVVTVVLVADGPVTHYLGLPFPAIAGGGVDTYLLPPNTDFSHFAQYLVAKNAVGWQGQMTRVARHRVLDKQNTLGRALTWGGSAILAYTFMAGLLGSFFRNVALPLAVLAPPIVIIVLLGTAQLWRKAKQDLAAMHLTLTNQTSWRLVNYARDQIDRTKALLKEPFKRQFFGEMCPQEALDTIIALGKTPTAELVTNARVREEVTAAASYVLGPRAGADKQQLTDALAHAITESKQKRLGGAAKVVIGVACARVQAILVKTGKASPAEMTPVMPLDDLFSATLARAKFPVPSSISVPLLDLEQDVASGSPINRERMTRAIAAATMLVEMTGHYWVEDTLGHVKEIPFPKASMGAAVVGDKFDDDFG